MTIDAEVIGLEALLEMHFLHLVRLMVMALEAGIFDISVGMTGLAGLIALIAMINFKDMACEECGFP